MDVVSFAEVPEQERFAFWREMSSKMWMPLDARCEPHLERAFQAQVALHGLGAVQATLLTAPALTIERTPRLIRRSDPETLFVTCTVRGHAIGEQAGRQADLGVGDLMLRDSSHPYLTRFGSSDPAGGQVLSVQFPRSLLPLPERGLRKLGAVRIRGDRGIGALASQYLLQLARELTRDPGKLSPAEATRISTLTMDVLTAALAGALDERSTVPSLSRRRALLAQIYAFIQANLGDADLNPAAIAAVHHISVSYLHQLFRTEGRTVAGWIRERRLEHCRRDLAEPWLADRTVTAIAARWGFTNLQHFSQAFRSTYGLSPREFRQQSATAAQSGHQH
ncbi:helix-turn-helix domain-containing protein [Herbidospora sp. NEAU-GS84]|uniref:Helix-turn-helix domain-containing protein n=1 Tax=Herbidospora solisilvae TaxID=2696284 RepID=A0A7C9JBM4_9ACTN|nr:helix-turn-helix domain-containing protein [Herbidospora solisilvae]NAS25968.1 helix-turn-helix domain-containing protein [Herbidospora solisilvae]